MGAETLQAPFPWFGGKSRVAGDVWARYLSAWIGQLQFAGCLPVILSLLFVDHRSAFRAATKAAVLFSANSWRCTARCCALLSNSRLVSESFSLFPSLWCMLIPLGIGPLYCSHTKRAYNTHVLGSATLMNARRSPFRLCRVRILTSPILALLSGLPFVNCPFSFRISELYNQIITMSITGEA